MEKKYLTHEVLGTLFLALGYSSLFVFTNIYDWDFVFSTLEVDIRSIVLDGKLPTWSYQLCAGSSREGDPQSYGQSPLMILPLLFGSFWGAKAILFSAVATGIHYLKKIIFLINKNLSSLYRHILIFSFLTSNFFLFHFSAGHLSFSSVFFAFPLLYLCLKIVMKVEITRFEYVANSLFLTLLLTGGFFQASLYFVLPLALVFILYHLLEFKPLQMKKISLIVGSSLFAVLISLYRIIPVLEYQKKYPRILESSTEWNSLYHQFLYFLLPIFEGDYLFSFKKSEYNAGEDSYFGSLIILSVFLIIGFARTWFSSLKALSSLTKFSFCLIIVGLSLSFGGDGGFYPFHLLNTLFDQSIRVPSRFNFLTYLGLFVLVVDFLKLNIFSDNNKKRIYLSVGFLSILSLFQYGSAEDIQASLFHMKQIHNVDSVYQDQMQMVHVGKMRGPKASHMYIPILLGFSFPNCYQPMARKMYLISEDFKKASYQFDFHFMYKDDGSQNPQCLEKSFFTQSSLYIDPSCDTGSRVHLNFIQPEFLKKFNIKATNHGYRL